jgi:hypothetical protein
MTKKYFMVVLLMFSLVEAKANSNQPADEVPTARSVIQDIVSKLKESDKSLSTFDSLDPGSLTFASKILPNGEGWMVKWHYEKNIKWVPNPNKGAPQLAGPAPTDEAGIFITIFVSYGRGDLKEPVTRLTIVTERPKFDIGYALITGSSNDHLKGSLDKIIAEEKLRLLAAGTPSK